MMSIEDGDDDWDSAVALRAKAAHCLDVAKIMGPETRARLFQKAREYLERAAELEEAGKE